MLRRATSLAPSLIERSKGRIGQHSWSTNGTQRQRSGNSLNEVSSTRTSPHFYLWPHTDMKYNLSLHEPQQTNAQRMESDVKKQGNTHQALSEFHRTIEGRRKEKPRLSQNKKRKKKKKEAGMDED